jgi:hypothetical protein
VGRPGHRVAVAGPAAAVDRGRLAAGSLSHGRSGRAARRHGVWQAVGSLSGHGPSRLTGIAWLELELEGWTRTDSEYAGGCQ